MQNKNPLMTSLLIMARDRLRKFYMIGLRYQHNFTSKTPNLIKIYLYIPLLSSSELEEL